MVLGLVHAHTTRGPGNLAAYVTCMGDPSDVVRFNVLWHVLVWSLFTTNIACGEKSFPGTCRDVTFGDCTVKL